MAAQYRLGPGRRMVNTMMKGMVRLGGGPKSTFLMTTTGRQSGLERTTPVTLVEGDDGRWLVAPYGPVAWVHNVRASNRVTLRRGRRHEVAYGEEVGADTAGPVLRRYLSQVGITAPFFDAKKDDPPEAFVAEAGRHPVFRLHDTDPAGA